MRVIKKGLHYVLYKRVFSCGDIASFEIRIEFFYLSFLLIAKVAVFFRFMLVYFLPRRYSVSDTLNGIFPLIYRFFFRLAIDYVRTFR
jgi:hypothetical protein